MVIQWDFMVINGDLIEFYGDWWWLYGDEWNLTDKNGDMNGNDPLALCFIAMLVML